MPVPGTCAPTPSAPATFIHASTPAPASPLPALPAYAADPSAPAAPMHVLAREAVAPVIMIAPAAPLPALPAYFPAPAAPAAPMRVLGPEATAPVTVPVPVMPAVVTIPVQVTPANVSSAVTATPTTVPVLADDQVKRVQRGFKTLRLRVVDNRGFLLRNSAATRTPRGAETIFGAATRSCHALLSPQLPFVVSGWVLWCTFPPCPAGAV